MRSPQEIQKNTVDFHCNRASELSDLSGFTQWDLGTLFTFHLKRSSSAISNRLQLQHYQFHKNAHYLLT